MRRCLRLFFIDRQRDTLFQILQKDLPSIVVWGSSDTSASENSLTLDIHLLAGREHIAVGDHEILCNIGI